MTVQELIDELMKVEDKSKVVEIRVSSRVDYEFVTDVKEYANSVEIS